MDNKSLSNRTVSFTNLLEPILDGFVESRKAPFGGIPAKAGIRALKNLQNI
jgi:hypothetical protein